MLHPDVLQFLYELSQNNNKDWFNKNKARYESTVKKPFEVLVENLIGQIGKFEPAFRTTAKESIFRIYRDTRFSGDKTPYKTHLSAVFTSRGRKTMNEPGYYLQLGFGSLSLGGGAYFLDKEPLAKVRQAIAADPKAFRRLIESPAFADKYGGIQGEKNKILPPEWKEVAAAEPLLFNKQFYFMAEVDPELVTRPDAVAQIAAYFEAARPVNEFFRSALR